MFLFFDKLKQKFMDIQELKKIKEDVRIFAASPDDEPLTSKICDELGIQMSGIDHVYFSNGVYQPRLIDSVRGKFAVLVSTTYPNPQAKAYELQLILDALHRSHARFILLVVPYTAHARSDKKDQGHISIGFRSFAIGINPYISLVLFCDIHNDATEGFFRQTDIITARELIFNYAKNLGIQAMVSIDIGDNKRTKKMANALNVPWGSMDKDRKGNTDSANATNIFGVNLRDKVVLAIDDEVSTAGSIEVAGQLVQQSGAREFYVACSHGVFCGKALERITNGPITKVITTNTIPHDSVRQSLIDSGKLFVIDMSPKFAQSIKNIYLNKPLGKLFDYNSSYGKS